MSELSDEDIEVAIAEAGGKKEIETLLVKLAYRSGHDLRKVSLPKVELEYLVRAVHHYLKFDQGDNFEKVAITHGLRPALVQYTSASDAYFERLFEKGYVAWADVE